MRAMLPACGMAIRTTQSALLKWSARAIRGPSRCRGAHAERVALSALEGSLPVPRMVGAADAVMTTAFVDGAHGQGLIEAGYARQVLAGCGSVLRRLHSLDPTVIEERSRPGSVIVQATSARTMCCSRTRAGPLWRSWTGSSVTSAQPSMTSPGVSGLCGCTIRRPSTS